MPEPATFDPPAPGELAVHISREADVIVLTLTGELDLATSPMFERHVRDAEAAGPARLVIDLTGLGFMDSTGLQTLLRARERAHCTAYELALRRGPNQVHRVFELTRTIDAFTFDD